MNSIYEQLNKIDDKESLNEKYNVRTLEDIKKLSEAVTQADVSQLKNDLFNVDGIVTSPNFPVMVKKYKNGVRIYTKYIFADTTLESQKYALNNLNVLTSNGYDRKTVLNDYGATVKEFMTDRINVIINKYPEFTIHQSHKLHGGFDVWDEVTLTVTSKDDENNDASVQPTNIPAERKFSKNDIIYRYNFGLPMSEEDILKIGTVEQHEENAKRIHAAVLAIKKWDPSISVSKKRDWTSMLLILRRGAKGGLTDEERDELRAVISNVTNFKDIIVYDGSSYLRCDGFVDIGPDVRELINQ